MNEKKYNHLYQHVHALLDEGWTDHKEIAELTGAKKDYVYQIWWNRNHPELVEKYRADRATRNQELSRKRMLARKRKAWREKRDAAVAAALATQQSITEQLQIPLSEPTKLPPPPEFIDVDDYLAAVEKHDPVYYGATIAEHKGHFTLVPEDKPVDMVNSPSHYTDGGIETIDYIRAKLSREEYIGYLRGNILKYTSRLGKKDNLAQDAGKLAWYTNELASFVGKG